ncbi:hypothetical protein GIB67_014290 [Kingdonia uniflora]|uniref:Uncharacterized protein n=1 Tax=Kingdonia uniflora TaxID=39325 RepID=A0A7J7M222_9MAGN|nr:hypothetical protein GIB67_014290 [Kingdonia uniflora]
MVGLVFLVPNLVLRRETWLDIISWCPVFSCEQSHGWMLAPGKTWLDASSWYRNFSGKVEIHVS